MSDETSRVADVVNLASVTRSQPKSSPDFGNVEFLESSLSDPLNALRSKLKELLEASEAGIRVRRIVILTDLVDETGRGLDVAWSDAQPNEDTSDALDSVLAMMLRAQAALTVSLE